MASLKELKNKINVIESTRKVTSAMKLVAGVKLRKAEYQAVSTREYSHELNTILTRLRRDFLDSEYDLFSGKTDINASMLVVFAADRGLCGNFNYVINKETSKIIADLHDNGRKIKILCAGSKLFEPLKKILMNEDSIELIDDFYKNGNIYDRSLELSRKIISYFHAGLVGDVSIIYTKFLSAMSRSLEYKSIIPLSSEPNPDKTVTVFEPNAEEVLNELLPYNIAIQLYQAALESIASEQSSRMTSMDNATRNADSLLSDFRIKYNRIRQAKITQELVEVISGARAITKG